MQDQYEKFEDCVRIRTEINGENYYVTIGANFVHVTVPRENDPNISHERAAFEKVTDIINKAREEYFNK